VGLVNIKIDDRECLEASEDFYTKLQLAGVDVLYDDRDERTGAKLANMDLIGLPWQIIVGPRGLKAGVVEIKNRRTGVLEECSIDQVMTKFRD
jgi:prolyl-tRNA synthetase